MLFTYAIPFYHFSLRTKCAFKDKYALTGYVVNGWNNLMDSNTGKTLGMTLGWTPYRKFSLSQNYVAGPEMADAYSHWQQHSDTVITISPTERLSF